MKHIYKFKIWGSFYEETSARRRNALIVLREIVKKYNLPDAGEVTISIDGGDSICYTYMQSCNYAIGKKDCKHYIYI